MIITKETYNGAKARKDYEEDNMSRDFEVGDEIRVEFIGRIEGKSIRKIDGKEVFRYEVNSLGSSVEYAFIMQDKLSHLETEKKS